MDLFFARLEFIIRCHAEPCVQLVMERLKKTFRETFRAQTCVKEGGCDRCDKGPNCSYLTVFGQSLATDRNALRRYQKPPLPFVFQPCRETARLNPGDSFRLGLLLVGSAVNYVPEFCSALSEVVRRCPDLSLERVDSVDCSGFANTVLREDGAISFDKLATVSAEDIFAVSALPPDHVMLHFLTPLCLMQDGAVIREFSFSKFITSLFRRISSLAYYYGGSVLEMDYKRLSELSKVIKILENTVRYTGRSEWKKEGLLGKCLVTGAVSEFHQVLLLGEYLHCGKGAVYGMGRYEIVRSSGNA